MAEAGDLAGCGDARGRLGRQGQAEPIEDPLVGVGLGVAVEDQRAPVGGGEVDVERLDGGKLVEHGSRGEPCGERTQSGAQRDMQTIGQEGDKICASSAAPVGGRSAATRDRPDGFERRLDLDQLDVDFKLGWVFPEDRCAADNGLRVTINAITSCTQSLRLSRL